MSSPLPPRSTARPPRTVPPSPRTRGRLYQQLSSIIEGSFLETDDGIGIRASVRGNNIGKYEDPRTNLTQLAPTQAVTESIRLPAKKAAERPVLSFVIVYTMIFFNGCCFTAVVPSVPFYLSVLGAPPSFLGLVVSFYSVGQLIGSPIAGRLNDRIDSKTMLTLSSLIGLIASTFYAAAPNHWYILLSRVMTGVSAGMEFTTELAFIARNTTTDERTTFLASVTAVNVLGFIMGPALTTVLSLLEFEVMGLVVNEYTGPGWLLVIMFAIDLIMIRLLFEDSSLTDDAVNNDESLGLLENGDKEADTSYGAITEEEQIEQVENGTKHISKQKPTPPSLTLVLSLIFTQFSVMCAWSVLETITSPLAFDSFGWSVTECNLLFTCGGAASLLAYISFVIASKWVEDRLLIVYALIACVIGLFLMIHWTVPLLPPYKYCFLAGYLIMNAGFMTGRPVCFALYSKLIPSCYQGEFLGYMVAGGSAARTLGPFFAVWLYYHIEGPWKNTLALFGSEIAICLFCLVLVISMWPSLLPAKPKLQKRLIDKSSDRLSTHSSATGEISMHVDEKKVSQ